MKNSIERWMRRGRLKSDLPDNVVAHTVAAINRQADALCDEVAAMMDIESVVINNTDVEFLYRIDDQTCGVLVVGINNRAGNLANPPSFVVHRETMKDEVFAP